jgi:aspartate oxidase
MQFGEYQLGHPALTEPVRADYHIDRNTLLGNASGVFECRRRRGDLFHRDVVTQCVQHRRDVVQDARGQQLDHSRIAAQFPNLVFDRGLDPRADHVDLPVQPSRNHGDIAIDVNLAVRTRATRVGHHLTVDPGQARWK